MQTESKALTVISEKSAAIADRIAPILALKATDDDSARVVVAAGKTVKECQKEIESTRKQIVDPFNKFVKAVNAKAKEVTEQLDKAESHIKTEMLAWENFRRAEEEKKRAAQEAEKDAARLFLGDSVDLQIPDVISTGEKINGIRKIWDFEIQDFDKIPMNYLQLNEKAIREAIKNGARDIPGIKILQRETVAISTR